MAKLVFAGISRVVADSRIAEFNHVFQAHSRLILPQHLQRTADATELLGFMVNQLAYTEAGIYEVAHQPLQYRSFVPVSTAAGEWAESIRYEKTDYTGRGKRHSGKGRDIPHVDVQYDDKVTPIVQGAIGYDYTVDELRKSAYLRRPVDSARMRAAMRGFEEHMNDVALLGEAESGLTGLFNSPVVPVTTITGAWSTKTPEEKLADVNNAIFKVWEQSRFTEMPNMVLLPPEQYTDISSNPRSDNSDKTVLQYILENNIAKHRGVNLMIEPAYDLQDAGVGGTTRMVVYTKDESKVVFHIPLPLRFLAPQLVGLDIEVPGEYKYSGVEFRYPKSAHYFDGL